MKSGKVDYAAKVASKPTLFAAEIDSPARKEDIARVGSYEKSTKPASGDAVAIYVLLKLDLLEVMNVCVNKAVKEVVKIMAAEAYSSVEEIKRLDSELVALKWSNIYTPASLQLETACHEIVDLKTRFDAIQASIGEVVGEVSAQAGATGGEAPDDAAAKSVTAVEGVATE
ncbi:hypothetical protein ACFX1R_005795 [Malus domestica]